MTMPARRDVNARFDEKVERMPSGCWEWRGAIGRSGYGNLWTGAGYVGAHRFAFERAHGPIAAGMYVAHACDNKRCVNPAHLWMATPKQNQNDMLAKGRHPRFGRTHCMRGHLFTPENTVRVRNSRTCRTCHNERCRHRYHDRKRVAA